MISTFTRQILFHQMRITIRNHSTLRRNQIKMQREENSHYKCYSLCKIQIMSEMVFLKFNFLQ